MDSPWVFLAVSLALTGSPGPNTLSLAAVGAAFGFRRGADYMAGLTFGMVLVTALVATGLAGLLLSLPGVAPVVTGLAVIYFLYLAARIATAPTGVKRDQLSEPPNASAGIFVSLANPKAYAAVGAAMAGYVLVDHGPLADALVKSTLFLTTIVLVNLVWLSFGAAMTTQLTDPKTGRIANICFAALLLLSVSLTVFL